MYTTALLNHAPLPAPLTCHGPSLYRVLRKGMFIVCREPEAKARQTLNPGLGFRVESLGFIQNSRELRNQRFTESCPKRFALALGNTLDMAHPRALCVLEVGVRVVVVPSNLSPQTRNTPNPKPETLNPKP